MSGEVSIAELIGWEICSAWWIRQDGTWAHTPPTPDDLLAWLLGKHQEVEMCAYPAGSDLPEAFIEVTVDADYSDGHYDHFKAPTLLAALEAAVRAVAAVPAEDDKP